MRLVARETVSFVSIHAPRMRGDTICLLTVLTLMVVSIHAPRMRGDKAAIDVDVSGSLFQSTPLA